MRYKFVAINQQGEKHSGVVTSPSLQEAYVQLSIQSFYLLSIKQEKNICWRLWGILYTSKTREHLIQGCFYLNTTDSAKTRDMLLGKANKP